MTHGKFYRRSLPQTGLTSPYIGFYHGPEDALEVERQRLSYWRRKAAPKRHLLLWLEISIVLLVAFGLYLSTFHT
jgi:hypothetical protein